MLWMLVKVVNYGFEMPKPSLTQLKINLNLGPYDLSFIHAHKSLAQVLFHLVVSVSL